ncbi:hypothetical protein NA57DRAFT_78921 [Rhizodiscina lignyota]|uniref:Uncharacterized protein n=1 Tax=Rhizodiscina lignyota TaxID=1504668 RepID=A0A9P4IBD7_9PEZI|nr:hypothetical protein NA57DRAFT_78921 [Rhizodiscina lignyota]
MAGDTNSTGAATAQHLNIGIVVGIAVAGLVILAVLVGLVILIVKARKSHKRLINDLESRGADIRRPSIAEIQDPNTTRTRTVLRRNNCIQAYGNCQSGWDSLDSHESYGKTPDYGGPLSPYHTFHYSEPAEQTTPERAKHLPWPFSRGFHHRHGRGQARQSTLSAITEAFSESPSSRQVVTPRPLIPDPDEAAGPDPYGYFGNRNHQDMHDEESSPVPTDDDHRPDSPHSSAVALPALKPAPLSGPRGAETIRLVESRSKSIASLPSYMSREEPAKSKRPQMRGRSISLCSQTVGIAPEAPVPPLPVHLTAEEKRSSMVSFNPAPARLSVSSVESGGSSVLIRSPNPAVKRDRSFKLMEGAGREWANSLIIGPRPQKSPHSGVSKSPSLRRHQTIGSNGSIKSSIVRYSGDSATGGRLSRSSSVASSLSGHDHLSAGKIATAETIRLSRASSASSIGNRNVRLLHTPRRQSRISVDAKGSPSERRASILQDISGNSGPTPRERSQSPLRNSTSQGNDGQLFHWQSSPIRQPRPSALKGSPGARSPGHRRQNCVRISLQPTILGAASQNNSPPAMNGIKEESSDDMLEQANALPNPLTTKRDLPRPPTASAFQPDVGLGLTALRASLTSSSPRLSLVNFCQENFLPMEVFGLNSNRSSPYKRNSTRLSMVSSQLSIPSFPSPCKDRVPKEQMQPPTIKLSTPSMGSKKNEREDEDVFQDALSTPPAEETPKAPSATEDDLLKAFLALSSSEADGDALPEMQTEEPEATLQVPASSPPMLSIEGWHIQRSASPRHLPSSSSPCSPKTSRPPSFLAGSDSLPMNSTEMKSMLNLGKLEGPSPTDAELPSPSAPAMPPSVSRSNTLVGPRAQPANPLRWTVQTLRRMNSDAGDSFRAERHYLRMGRGASPTLPGAAAYRDSYMDFTSIANPDDVDQAGFGLGILDGLSEDEELDVDELLGIKDHSGEEKNDTAECGVNTDLSWFHSDEIAKSWDREDSGTLGSGGNQWNGTIRKVEQEESRRSSTVWEDGERFWEQNIPEIECPSSPCPKPAVLPRPNTHATSPAMYIPGLFHTHQQGERATSSSGGSSSQYRMSPRPAISAGPINAARKRRPERSSEMRKSAILNMSMSAGNRGTSVEVTQVNDGGKESSVRAAVDTPAGHHIKVVVQPPTGSSVVRLEGFSDSPRSLYDSDGFLTR